MKLDNNVLYIMAQNNYGEVTRQIVMPNSYKHQALQLAHSLPSAGQGGVQVTLARCQIFFILGWYEKKMLRIIAKHVWYVIALSDWGALQHH